MKSLYDALKEYAGGLSKSDSQQLKTAIVRYVVPGLGGAIPTGKRTTSSEITDGLAYLKTVQIDVLREIKRIQEQQFRVFQVSKASGRNYRYHLNKFVDWAVPIYLPIAAQGLQEAEDKPVFRFREIGVKKDTPADYWKNQGQQWPEKKKVALSDHEINPRLQSQIEEFKAHRLRTVRLVTALDDLTFITRYLGWLHRFRGMPLEELTFESAIPFLKISYNEVDFADERDPFLSAAIAEKRAQIKAEEAASLVIDMVEDYLTNCANMKKGGCRDFCKHLIALAKWVYRNETKRDFEDIPIINRLKKLRKEYNDLAAREQPSRPYALKSASWQDMAKVLDRLKLDADTTTIARGESRKATGVGKAIQRLLIVSLFITMPPRRTRVITQLSIGKTLQRGKVLETGFVPKSLLADTEQSFWCIVLNPEDYKTGNIYGPQSWEINNLTYSDGTQLYDYIEKWINQYRPLLNPNHNYLFVRFKDQCNGQEKGEPAPTGTVNCVVKYATLRALGKPITPKELRKMFVSYISNRPDISEADLEAAARAMGHSRKMQMEVYDQVTSEARLSKGMELANRLWSETLSKNTGSKSKEWGL